MAAPLPLPPPAAAVDAAVAEKVPLPVGDAEGDPLPEPRRLAEAPVEPLAEAQPEGEGEAEGEPEAPREAAAEAVGVPEPPVGDRVPLPVAALPVGVALGEAALVGEREARAAQESRRMR